MLDPQQANTFLCTASRKQWLIHLDAGPGTVSMDCSFSSYLAVTLKSIRFNSFYCSICIPDNQTGSWPWGPWRSCRAVPHTHGCSGDKPRGGSRSWTQRCPDCCCPRWGLPHPLVLTLEESRPGQGVGVEEVVDYAFPILLMTRQVVYKHHHLTILQCLNNCRGGSLLVRTHIR